VTGRRAALAVCAASLGLAACSFGPGEDHDDVDSPRTAPVAWRGQRRIAWVFGSGGPRCFVHVGVAKALEELGLAPDLWVGASAGALVAVLGAAGVRAAEIEAVTLDLGAASLVRLSFGTEERLDGSRIATRIDELLRRRVGTVLLERLAQPVAVVAAPRGGETPAAFSAGDAGVAVQASCAIEGRFTPVRIHGTAYVDPDHVRPLPVRLARALGARRVLAIDASAHEDRAPPGAERYHAGDLAKRALIEPDAEAADLVLHPDFGYWVNLSREFRLRAIDAGYRQTLARSGRLKALFA